MSVRIDNVVSSKFWSWYFFDINFNFVLDVLIVVVVVVIFDGCGGIFTCRV